MIAEVRYDSKQKEIESAALSVFLDDGFQGVTLEAVAERLGYTKQAIYYYYRNKEELVSSFCLSILQDSYREIHEICSGQGSPKERLLEVIGYSLSGPSREHGCFTLVHSLKRVIGGFKDSDRTDAIKDLMRRIPDTILSVIRQGVVNKEFRQEDPQYLSVILFGMISGVIMVRDEFSGPSCELLVDTCMSAEILLKGILV